MTNPSTEADRTDHAMRNAIIAIRSLSSQLPDLADDLMCAQLDGDKLIVRELSAGARSALANLNTIIEAIISGDTDPGRADLPDLSGPDREGVPSLYHEYNREYSHDHNRQSVRHAMRSAMLWRNRVPTVCTP